MRNVPVTTVCIAPAEPYVAIFKTDKADARLRVLYWLWHSFSGAHNRDSQAVVIDFNGAPLEIGVDTIIEFGGSAFECVGFVAERLDH